MKHDTENLGLIPDSIKEKIDLAPRTPATWHKPRRGWTEARRQRVLENLGRDHTTHPQAIKNAVSRVFGFLKRYAQPLRNRGK